MQKNILLSLRNITRHLTEKKINILLDYKIILSIIILLNLLNIFFINSVSNISALEYSNDTNLEFTFNPTLSLSLSGNLIIDDLLPGSSSDSNSINVNVSTNNVSGYNLSATVGSSNNATTNLTNTSNSNYTFTSLTSDTTNLTDFNPNTWGYSYSVDNGTTWSNYSGLPLYTSTPTLLFNIYNPSENTLNFKIGVKASNTQPLGEYTNTINFTATTYPSPLTLEESYAYYGKQKITITDPNTGITGDYYTMQDMTTTICQTADYSSKLQVVDIRDNTVYWIGRALDGNCWMTQNLKLGKQTEILTLTQATSNVDENGFILDGKSTNGIFDAYTIDGVANQNNSSQYYCTDDYGCYYNWYTATAGIGTTYILSGNVYYDICPNNWSLPTLANGQQLYNQYPSIDQMLVDEPKFAVDNINGKIPGFLLSGMHDDSGAKNLGGYSRYWYSTANNSQFALVFAPSLYSIFSMDGSSKFVGCAIRCLAK